MRSKLLLLVTLFIFWKGNSQNAPAISGDLMLCPWTNGTAVINNNEGYTTYQWYFKYWFTSDSFEAIPDATAASFTYDWYTYDQALLKVVVTKNGQTFESNTIQVDSYAWVGLGTMYQYDENIMSFDPQTESLLLCNGASFDLQVNNPPYNANIQWYKNGEPIVGANNPVLTISGAGEFHVVAAPAFCPNSTSSTAGTPTRVAMNPDCNLSVDNPALNKTVTLYPNPVKDKLTIAFDNQIIESVTIYSLTGQLISKTKINTTEANLDTSALSSGIYIVEVSANGSSKKVKLIKE